MSAPVPVPGACPSEKVTAYVDGMLAPGERLEIEAHVAACARCHDQEVFERGLRRRLRDLPSPEMAPALQDRIRRQRGGRFMLRRKVWMPALAAMLLIGLVVPGAAPFVAWELSLDHAHCHAKPRVPAEVFTSDPEHLGAWYEGKGREMPLLPASAGGLTLLGGRLCPLVDRRVAHVYYGSDQQQLSLYVVPGWTRFGREYEWRRGDLRVALLRVGSTNVALVSDDEQTIAAFRRSFARTVASR